MSASIVLGLLFAHLIGDFVMQSHEMASRKAESWFWLSMHVLTYTWVMFAAVAWTPLSTLGWLVFVVCNGLLHLATDAVTSRCTAYLWKQQQWHWFFVMVGVDQFIHAACLILTYEVLQ